MPRYANSESPSNVPPFKRNAKGNYWAKFDGAICTVFKGKYGGWSFVHDGQFSGEWFDDPVDAMHSVLTDLAERNRPRQQLVPSCLRFFGLTPPITRSEVMSCYRKWANATHPDRGGTCEAFKEVQSNFEAALQYVGAA